MNIVTLSDMHGHLPDIPKADLLLISGDICPIINHDWEYQRDWLDTTFRYWLRKTSENVKKIIGICGNHDWIFQDHPNSVPSLPWTYLQDQRTEYEDLKIWGTPHQPIFFLVGL